MINTTLLASVQEMIETLSETSLLLARAARWSGSQGFNPAAVFASPAKYWYWHRARKLIKRVAHQLEHLRATSIEARSIDDVPFEFPKPDVFEAVFDGYAFEVHHKIETSRIAVDHTLSEVGLLHARLRRSASI